MKEQCVHRCSTTKKQDALHCLRSFRPVQAQGTKANDRKSEEVSSHSRGPKVSHKNSDVRKSPQMIPLCSKQNTP